MHIHILGICGTFMAGIARLAIAAGHRVTGVDNVAYPPMSDQLQQLGIDIQIGFDEPLPDKPDLFVVGNAMTRGMPVIEQLLNDGRPYTSGPQWLHDHILQGRYVLAVGGTHGKTTTSSMLAWILTEAGLNPGFLIGGVPGNFDESARLGSGQPFVVEGDEYDSAFFDKRAKLVHYPARTLVINNIEHDHADIYPDVEAIIRQFHHVVRTIPSDGTIIHCSPDDNIQAVLDLGCWSNVEQFSLTGTETVSPQPRWQARVLSDDASEFEVLRDGAVAATVSWAIPGQYNVLNALASIAAAFTLGVTAKFAADALARYKLPARRLELRHQIGNTKVFLDFAHHPSAIKMTIDALRANTAGRVLAVVEPRSNTMRDGVHGRRLPQSMQLADARWFLLPAGDTTNIRCGYDIPVERDATVLAERVAAEARDGDVVVLMSNGNLTKMADVIAGRLAKP